MNSDGSTSQWVVPFTPHRGNSSISSGMSGMMMPGRTMLGGCASHHTHNSLGAIWQTYFNPLPASYIALDFSVLEFLAKEWSTGIHVPSAFTEKEMGTSYRTHLTNVKNWCSYKPAVTENIRRRQSLRLSAASERSTHIDSAQQDALRLELEGRTGDTDSEPELEEETTQALAQVGPDVEED
ncbi:hypothetical protein B0H17DRAFT_1149939 [Mycena rosella]|uniref:DUF6532 domain-containing protein n=1 Tax=Mycena rosella TaxID=1033263 RepID=A0AAD7FN23_MYCRO|nr:hypothetical protein B0H17DRAFT_1149939 [Mycena rosella]